MKYHRLTRDERYQIAALKESKHGVRAIARIIGRNPGTISRELKRNSYDKRNYFGMHAHKRAQKRARRSQESKLKIKAEVKAYVEARLRMDWSPEQISGRLMVENNLGRVSYSTIYRFIYRDAEEWGKLFRKLRSQRKRRKSRVKRSTTNQCSVQKSSIHSRPAIVEERSRLGDYERDTMRGKDHNPVLLTIVDRASRRTTLGWLPRNASMIVHKKTVSLLRCQPRKTITNDNGSEFSDHFFTAEKLKVPVYFCDPYKSNQRGTNENTNGLLRQYFPKNLDFKTITEDQIRRAARLINDRPRKCLAYRTPNEIHAELTRPGVALV